MAKKSADKKLDINKILIGAVLGFSIVALGIRYFTADKGEYAMVAIDNAETRYEISLEEDAIHTVTEGNFIVTLEVKDGAIRFINSQCPDHLCEGFGFVSQEDDFAVCMPAGVAVLITDER